MKARTPGFSTAEIGFAMVSVEFRQLPEPMLRKALESLVKRGKAQMLRGEGEAGEGVRFL